MKPPKPGKWRAGPLPASSPQFFRLPQTCPPQGYSPPSVSPRIRKHKWLRNQHFSGGRILAR